MWQLFTQIKIFNIFLLTMHLVSLTPTNLANNMVTACTAELPENTTCQCVQTLWDYIIQCPTSTAESEISVQIRSLGYHFRDVIIDCNDTDVNPYTYLPIMHIGNTSKVTFELYQLPSGPITQLLEHLGIGNVKIIYFAIQSTLFSIPDNLFKNLSDLQELYLHSIVTSLPLNIFTDLKKLETLNLRLNVTKLPPGIFRNQRNMTALSLYNEQSCNLQKETFEGAISLEEITFVLNDMPIFQQDAFSLLTSLRTFYLYHTHIRKLPAELFYKNINLAEVEISSGSSTLRTLPPKLFANMPHLKRIDISRNMENFYDDGFHQLHWSKQDFNNDCTTRSVVRITCGLNSITDDLFGNSSLIHGMILANNELEAIPAKLFSGHHDLFHLDLSFNRLQALPDKLLNDTINLEVLKLSNNHLTEITVEYFISLVNLKELHLNNNYLSNINRNAFDNNKNLIYLNMANNHIHFGDPYYQTDNFLNKEPYSPFQFLHQLQTLDLSNNSLEFIFKDWYHTLTLLTKLDLANNSITLLDVSKFILNFSHSNMSFKYSGDIILSIDLSHNGILTTNLTFIKSFENLPRKISVNVNDNPFECDCKLLPFVQYLQGEQREELKFATDKLMCNKPDELKGALVRNIEPKALICPFDPENCPRGCGCWEHTSELRLVVNCKNANLTEILTFPRSKPLALHIIGLHIENNQQSELPRASLPGYSDITQIFASGNNLPQIDVDNLPPNLTYLGLSHNNFKRIDPKALELFHLRNSFNKIVLSGNPWICDCKSFSFMQFIQWRREIITDSDEIYCANLESHKKIIDLSYGDICQNEQIMPIYLVVICVLLSFGFLASLSVVLYNNYRTEIKVWLYKYRICLCLVNEEELDRDKKYDAFISYSHKDTQFVAEHLVPELENGAISFKLCVDVRDFIVGEYISDQIINAIESSRRTIVVLSQNFVESVWAREEFRLAHQAALNEGRTRVIVIIYGDIGDTDLLDPDLRAYLKMNIYLKWGDLRFWDRLLYAMPHEKPNR